MTEYDCYRGFFIEDARGNNQFSFEKRQNKKIYVAPLKDGELCDVELGSEIVFSEIDEEELEHDSIGLKNYIKLKNYRCPVYIFDNHNHAYFFWFIELKRKTYDSQIQLIHIDQHKDMRSPEKEIELGASIEQVFKYVNFDLNVGNFIVPALKNKIMSEVIIIDSTEGFNRSEFPDEYVLDIDIDIFSKDMDYIDWNLKVNKIKSLMKNAKMITIATSPYFIEWDRVKKALEDIFADED